MLLDLRCVRFRWKGVVTISVGAAQPRQPVGHPRTAILPTTYLGRWAVGLAAAFCPLVFTAAVGPRGAALGFVCGLASGAAALVAIIRDRERAVTVFAALAPAVLAVGFLLAELISANR
jgi:hypothetical protein